MSPPILPSKKKIFCNACQNETNHVIQCEHEKMYCDEEHGQLIFYEKEIYRFWTCAGCETGTMEVCFTMSGMHDSNGNEIFDYNYHPKRTHGAITVKWFNKLPEKLAKLYKESVEAYNYNQHILCATGLRAIIEGVCVNKKIEGRNLYNKIENLTSLLPKNIVKNLHSFRFMGNMAVHELEPPDKSNLKLAIEISEDLLNYLYDLDYKANLLNKKNKARRT
jgi:hypothetical protein